MSHEVVLPPGLMSPDLQEVFDPNRDLDPDRADLTPGQRAFVSFAKGHEGRFDIYGVDASQNFMVTGLRHRGKVKTVYRQYFTAADPLNPHSLSDIYPFRVDKDIWLTQDKNGEVSLDRIINQTPEGQSVNASFNPGSEFISFKIGSEDIGITYIRGSFSYFSFFGQREHNGSTTSDPLEPQQIGHKLPEFKWHDFEYADGGDSLLFKGIDEGVQARIPMSVNRNLIIGGLLSPQMRQNPTNFSPKVDEYWQKADLVDLFGIKINASQS